MYVCVFYVIVCAFLSFCDDDEGGDPDEEVEDDLEGREEEAPAPETDKGVLLMARTPSKNPWRSRGGGGEATLWRKVSRYGDAEVSLTMCNLLHWGCRH